MLQVIVNAIFKVLTFLAGIVLTPIVALIGAFIPDFSSYVSGILTFFTSVCEYVPFVVRLLMIPPEFLSAVVIFFTSYVTFKLGYNAYQVILQIWKAFKP